MKIHSIIVIEECNYSCDGKYSIVTFQIKYHFKYNIISLLISERRKSFSNFIFISLPSHTQGSAQVVINHLNGLYNVGNTMAELYSQVCDVITPPTSYNFTITRIFYNTIIFTITIPQ